MANSGSGETVVVTVGREGGFATRVGAQPSDVVKLLPADRAGKASAAIELEVDDETPAPPPDPFTVALRLDPAVATELAPVTAFLYTGDVPIEKDLAAGTIELLRAAALRRQVTHRNGGALARVSITVLGPPEYGHPLSPTDALFDLAVNGGALLIVRYTKKLFLPAQRSARQSGPRARSSGP